MTPAEKFIRKARQAEVIATLPAEVIKNILNKYEVLGSIEVNEIDESVLYDNEMTYRTILLPIVYRTLYSIVGGKAYNQLKSSIPHIDKVLTDKNGRDRFFGKYGKKLAQNGVEFDEYEELSRELIELVLDFFGVKIADSEEELEEADIIEDLDDDIDLSSLEDTSDELEEAEDEPEETELDKLKDTWGDKLDIVINGVMSTYKKLYASGYGLVSPCGVLTNIGAVRSTTDGRIIQSGNKAMDMELFRVIVGELKGNYDLYAENEKEPDIFEIERAGKPIIYSGMHLQFMFGHLRFCKGINKYLKEHNIENKSTTKVLKWETMQGFIRETIERYFYTAYQKYGVTSEATDNDMQIANKINTELSKNLKNVIILAERKKGVNTRVRIASDSVIDVEGLIGKMRSALNVGTDNSINVRQVGKYEDGVLDINVVYNEKKFSQDTLFAYQVLDILEEQGIKPRWDNVILGKKDNGTIMTYNFKDKRNAVYAIYASSGAGKGVMTLNLIASAVADLCKILYVDGKPDMGEVLADIAWKNGVEAPVYNGVSGKGSEMLENRGTSRRVENPFMDAENIPNGIFITDNEAKKFMLITTYLRGIELICDMAAYRSSQDLPGDDWVVAFVDECEQASVAEIDTNECLDRAEAKRKTEKDENGKRINPSTDDILQFINNYRTWQQSIKSKFKTCITSTFRYANMTTMFIWQSTKFPEQYKNKSVIAGVIDASAGVITKIMGRGAAVNYGSKVFGTPTSLEKATWYDARFKERGGGYFAIGKDATSNNMEVFRPFNIYSDANHKALIVENAKAVGISEEDLKGVSLDNLGNVIPEVGFDGYITKMLAKYNLTMADQMASSYEYFNTFITGRGGYANLNCYMFDCHSFNVEAGGSSDEGMQDGFSTENLGKYYFSEAAEESGELEDKLDEYGEEISKDGITSGYNGAINEANAKRIDEYRKGVKEAYKAKFDGESVHQSIFDPDINPDTSTVGVELVNGKIKVNDKSGFDVIPVDKENFVETQENEKGTVGRFIGKLMDNSYGMNYNFKQRWQFILDAISRSFPRDSMVMRVHVLYDVIMVNNKIVNVTDMLDDGYGIMLEDIVNFSSMLRRFPSIKEIRLDQESFRWVAKEFSTTNIGVYEVFKHGKNLDRLIVESASGTYEITRDGRNMDETNRRQSEAEFRQQIDQMSAGYNTRVKKKGSVYMHRMSDTNFGFTKNNWGRVKNNFIGTNGKRHVVRGTLWLGLAAVTGTVGSIFWGGAKVMKKFGK